MWKGVLFFLISVPIIILGLYSVTRVPPKVQGTSGPLPLEINYAERVKQENAGMPSYIQIPSLNLFADVEVVKIDDSGKLREPKNLSNIGMYAEDNNRLGQKGVVVFAAHFDQENGRQGTFYYVSSLQKGDLILITDLNGKKFEYVVKDKAAYDWNSQNVSSLLNKYDSPRLALIIYPPHTEENRSMEESKTILYGEIK